MAGPCVPDRARNTDSRQWGADEKLNWGCSSTAATGHERQGNKAEGVSAGTGCRGQACRHQPFTEQQQQQLPEGMQLRVRHSAQQPWTARQAGAAEPATHRQLWQLIDLQQHICPTPLHKLAAGLSIGQQGLQHASCSSQGQGQERLQEHHTADPQSCQCKMQYCLKLTPVQIRCKNMRMCSHVWCIALFHLCMYLCINTASTPQPALHSPRQSL